MDATRLNKLYPKIDVRNRTAAPQHVLYKNNQSVQINGGATRSLSSRDLLQLPDSSLFEMVRPTTFQLHRDGIINLDGKKPEVEPPVAEDEPSVEAGTPGGGEIASGTGTADPANARNKTVAAVPKTR